MGDAAGVLGTAQTVLVIDWPSKDVPESLARAGLAVVVHGGPRPEDYSSYSLDGDEVVVRKVGAAPDHADIVYSYRPVEELPGIVTMASELGATTVWVEPGSNEARKIVEAAGLRYVDDPPLVDAARSLVGG